MSLKTYLHNRFYLRGTSKLGLLNTLLATLFNRVIVRHIDSSGQTIHYSLKKGTDFPPKN